VLAHLNGRNMGLQVQTYGPSSRQLLTTFLSQVSHRIGSARNNGQQSSMPLGSVALTGYRLFATSVIVGTGIPKAVYSYYGQSVVSPTLDLLGGLVFGLLLV